jgi:hypothetical protein
LVNKKLKSKSFFKRLVKRSLFNKDRRRPNIFHEPIKPFVPKRKSIREEEIRLEQIKIVSQTQQCKELIHPAVTTLLKDMDCVRPSGYLNYLLEIPVYTNSSKLDPNYSHNLFFKPYLTRDEPVTTSADHHLLHKGKFYTKSF